MPTYDAVVPPEAGKGTRLDRYVSEELGLLSRSQLKARLVSARVNGKAVKLSRKLEAGDRIELEWKEIENSELLPQDIPLSVIWEDERAVVVDKPQGLVVHPGAGNPSGTLANALLFRRLSRAARSSEPASGQAAAAGEGLRPGIVHRLDKDTSGVIIAAYDEETLAFLADQFKSRRTRKTYLAIVQGAPKDDSGTVSTLLGRDPRDRKRFAVVERAGKPALTRYKVLERYRGYALVALRPKTGRTHQLRVHLKHLGCPILGDPVYARPDRNFPRATLMLHAFRLKIVLPGERERRSFTAPMPERFRELIRKLRSRSS
jgi:23S rRNA pseudouridine1911/1915/1917 synthase